MNNTPAHTIKDKSGKVSFSVLRRYSWADLVFFFLVYSMIGWIYETLLEVVIYQSGFTNRGILFGPWLPVYGFGAVLFLLLWYRLLDSASRKRKLALIPVIFLLTALTATAVELPTSYILEWANGSFPWDYTEFAMDFEGRIAVNPSVRFGLGGVLFLYLIQPLLDKASAALGKVRMRGIAIAILAVLACDCAYCFFLR